MIVTVIVIVIVIVLPKCEIPRLGRALRRAHIDQILIPYSMIDPWLSPTHDSRVTTVVRQALRLQSRSSEHLTFLPSSVLLTLLLCTLDSRLSTTG